MSTGNLLPAAEAASHALPPALIHDLRTPLSQIIGYSELLVEQAQDAGDDGYVPYLQRVAAAGQQLLGMIESNFHAAGAVQGMPPPDPLRLSTFILDHREPILAEWEAFARTCTPASGAMDIVALRDHAGAMLTVIAADLDTPQGGRAQREKSQGNAPDDGTGPPTAAEEHGAGRAESGFSVEQMISEYRALRASVIRLWTKAKGTITPADVNDLTRFNEAIDQSLAESISRYSDDLDYSKEMFLAVLGHDLRTPLGAILTSSRFMLETQALKEPTLTLTSRIASSSTRMVHMIGDLLDFTRSRLGGGIPIVRAPAAMGKVVHDVVDEIAAAHPGRTLQVSARGEQKGEWDCARITQALTNLVGNALEHGGAGTAVAVDVAGDDREVTVAIHNRGPAIPADRLDGIFNPMKSREPTAVAAGPAGNLGLGLYIAERIVNAHNGRIAVESSEAAGTTFTVHLPRHGQAGTVLASSRPTGWPDPPLVIRR